MTTLSVLANWDDRALINKQIMALESLAIFAIFFLLHWCFYGGTPNWTDADAPYHHLLQAEIHAHGWYRDVTWLPYTILGEAGPDHHWLWHLLLSPFSAIDDLPTRIDLSNAFSFALVPAFTNLALRLIGIRAAPLWVFIMMAGTTWTLFRWSMARAQNPACILMILFFAALTRRHKLSLLLVPFVFMHTYHGAALLAVPGMLYFAINALRTRKPDWWLLALPAGGALLALITSPWYPDNISYFLFHTLDKVGNRLELQVGMEWYGTGLLRILLGLQVQMVALLVVIVAAGSLLWRQASTLLLATLGTLLIFLFFTTSHARFIEYCSPVVVLLGGLVVRDCAEKFSGRIRPWLLAPIIPLALFIGATNLATADQWRAAGGTLAMDFHKKVGQFLTHFAAPGSLIVNTRWDHFPYLVWYAPGLRYLSGLDPYYLAFGDDKRFIALEKLNGDFHDRRNPVVDVRNDFGSDWVVTGKMEIARYLARSGQAAVVMRQDNIFVIYVGVDPTMPERLVTEGSQWLGVFWRRPPPKPANTSTPKPQSQTH